MTARHDKPGNARMLRQQIVELQARLAETEEVLRAIHEGEVDAVVVSGPQGQQVYSLIGAEQVYRRIVETMNEAALTVTFEGVILFANARFGELIGRAPQQIIGHRVGEFVAVAGQPHLEALLAAARQQPMKQRLVLEAADGTAVPTHVATNVLNESQEPSICMVAADLTELENWTELIQQLGRQQRALRRNQEWLALATSASHIGMFDWEVASGRILWTQTLEAIFDYAPGGATTDLPTVEHDYSDWTDRVHPDDLPWVEERLRGCAEGGAPFDVQYRILWPDGTLHWVAACGVMVGGEAPAAARMIGVAMDITDQKQAEEALRESEQRFRALVSASSAVLYRMSPDWSEMRQLHGAGFLADTEAPNSNWLAEYIHPDDQPRVAAVIHEAIRTKSVFRLEHRVLRADGSLGWTSSRAIPLLNADGEIVEWFGAADDITDRKHAEEALCQARDELEKRVIERTRELSYTVETLQDEIARRELAEEVLRRRSEQLRLLASELTLAEQRERRRLAQVLHDNLQQLLVGAKYRLMSLSGTKEEATKRAVAGVRDLLDESIECSRSLTSDLSPPVLHQGGLVPALEWLAVWMKKKHGLNVELRTQDSADPQSEDIRVLLFQSIRELLFNAAKHANVWTVKVCLRNLNDDVEVTVSDNGAGFDPKNAGAREGKAGGYGLFSIRERLDLLGGSLEIDSAPGRGSRFTLRAPRGTAAAEREPPSTLAGVPITRAAPLRIDPAVATGSTAQRIRVLLADDHVVVRQGLSHLLREQPDIEIVAEASDGQAAVEMARRYLPDVVMMDISMSRMDGIQATKVICTELPEVKVIGLSMFEQGERAKAMRAAGAADYLTKTGPSEALLAAIRACARDRDRPERHDDGSKHC